MARGFYFARRMKNGIPVVDNGMELRAYPNAKLPEYQTKNAAGADFFCAEEVCVPSIWESVASYLAADNETGDVCFVGGRYNCEEYFKPTLVHTGIKASMYDDEVWSFTTEVRIQESWVWF